MKQTNELARKKKKQQQQTNNQTGFSRRADERYGSKNISSCTVSYTSLLMKTDLYFQPVLS